LWQNRVSLRQLLGEKPYWPARTNMGIERKWPVLRLRFCIGTDYVHLE
jgi:hypothetical protein